MLIKFSTHVGIEKKRSNMRKTIEQAQSIQLSHITAKILDVWNKNVSYCRRNGQHARERKGACHVFSRLRQRRTNAVERIKVTLK